MCTSAGEIGAEAVATDVLYVMLLWYWWHCDVRVLSEEGSVKVDEIREAPPDGEMLFLEDFEVRLFAL